MFLRTVSGRRCKCTHSRKQPKRGADNRRISGAAKLTMELAVVGGLRRVLGWEPAVPTLTQTAK